MHSVCGIGLSKGAVRLDINDPDHISYLISIMVSFIFLRLVHSMDDIECIPERFA